MQSWWSNVSKNTKRELYTKIWATDEAGKARLDCDKHTFLCFVHRKTRGASVGGNQSFLSPCWEIEAEPPRLQRAERTYRCPGEKTSSLQANKTGFVPHLQNVFLLSLRSYTFFQEPKGEVAGELLEKDPTLAVFWTVKLVFNNFKPYPVGMEACVLQETQFFVSVQASKHKTDLKNVFFAKNWH